MSNGNHKTAIVTGRKPRTLGRNTAIKVSRDERRWIFSSLITQIWLKLKASSARAEAMGKENRRIPELDAGNIILFDGFANDVRNTLGSWGRDRFDYLVNNAGTSLHKAVPIKQPKLSSNQIVNVHFKGVYFLTQKLLPLMNDGGRIVNIFVGTGTLQLMPGSSAYGAAKGAIEVLTRLSGERAWERVESQPTWSPRGRSGRISAAEWCATIRRSTSRLPP